MQSPPTATPSAAEARLGRVLADRYRLESLLGSGGIGVVYRALDQTAGRIVALKVLSEGFELSGQAMSRFRREGAALTRLAHPHIVEVFEHGVADGMAFMAMELLEGETLASHIDAHAALPLPRALDIAAQVLSALAYAHDAKIVHRDLKPSNVFIVGAPEEPRVKLLDFGLVKFLEPEEHDVDQTLTRSGMVMGTPLYMAPEQCTGDRVDARVDVYAAGCMLYELLSGEPPFLGDSQAEVARAHLIQDVPELALEGVAPELVAQVQALITRSMAKRPDDRFGDAGQMLAALCAVQAGLEPRNARSPGRASGTRARSESWRARALIAAGVLAAAALVFAYFGYARDPWQAGVPNELGAIHGRVMTGQGIDRDEQRVVGAYAHKHADDPRPHLLLAHGFANQGWRKDAIQRYLKAYEIDRTARHDPRVLPTLLRLAESDAHGEEACEAIARLYGAEAAEAVAARLATLQPGPFRTRLQALLARLSH